MPIHKAIYCLYPFNAFLPKESIGSILALLNTLDIPLRSSDWQHKQKIVAVEKLSDNKENSVKKCTGRHDQCTITFIFP